ncbi:MAG: c-type cytochrome, partial [Anaerolineae bacterium]|nr:c-type cytochrome [Anaerolineae bacterium]
KFYGPVTLGEPLQGEFDVAYDAELTEMIRNPAELTPIERGRRVFATYCSACHGSYAEGLPGIPSLNTDQVRSYTDEQLLTIISNGVINTAMPAWGIVLSPEDLQGAFELVRNIEILSQ